MHKLTYLSLRALQAIQRYQKIDKDVLFNAIVQNEGGKDSVKYFAKSMPNFTALDRGVGAQDTTREPGISLPPEPTIESETVKPTPTGLTNDQLRQRILDQEAALAKEEATRPPLPAADAGSSMMMTPVGPVGAPAAQAMPDISTAPADKPSKSLLERIAPSLYRSANEDITGTTFPTVDSETNKTRTPTGRTNAELRQDILDQEAALAEEEASRQPLPTPTGKTNAELRENILRQDMALHGEEIDARNRSQRADIGGLPEGAVEVPDLPETQEPGLLSRLGGFAKDNPELLAQIAQAGGGLMQNIAQGRAQRQPTLKRVVRWRKQPHRRTDRRQESTGGDARRSGTRRLVGSIGSGG